MTVIVSIDSYKLSCSLADHSTLTFNGMYWPYAMLKPNMYILEKCRIHVTPNNARTDPSDSITYAYCTALYGHVLRSA